ncbi:MAG: hypothetical protein SV422_14105 [Pseudomonadota bacterium]|nr:hypothetical protein [Pseudomonadota bacterium]
MDKSATYSMPARDRRNVGRYVRFAFVWALVYVACTFALAFDYAESIALRMLLAFVPSVFAILAVRAYWRYMQEMDELLRAIELKALALAISVGFVVWPAMELLELLPLDIDIPVTMLVMTACYVYGLMRGRLAHL